MVDEGELLPRSCGIIVNGFGIDERDKTAGADEFAGSIASEWIESFKISDAVVWGYPESIISSISSYINIKFRRRLSSLRTPQKSLKDLINLFNKSTAQHGDTLDWVVNTK